MTVALCLYNTGMWLLMALLTLAGIVPVQSPPTIRSVLTGMKSTDIPLVPDACLDTPVKAEANERFIQLPCHLNPSAEQLFVFSRTAELKGILYGWTLVTLPNEFIVYENSQVHFAPTHSLGISAFDPQNGNDRKIYPPMPYSSVRSAFIARVAEAYKARGPEWFRIHNHPGDPESFDSDLIGDIDVDAAQKRFSFNVRFGDPQNQNDPLPFSQDVRVVCGPYDSLERLRCTESPR